MVSTTINCPLLLALVKGYIQKGFLKPPAENGGNACVFYLRVSTDEQTVENQRQALIEAIERRGWHIVVEYADNGVSGAKGREKRPGFDALLKAATKRKIDVVAAWSVDRLGRSLQHLVSFLAELDAVGCDLYLEKQSVDTTTPAGRALFQMLGVFAEFERSILQDRIHAGIARARKNGTKSGKPIGRARISAKVEDEIRSTLAAGNGIIKTSKLCGVGVGTVMRVKRELCGIVLYGIVLGLVLAVPGCNATNWPAIGSKAERGALCQLPGHCAQGGGSGSSEL